MSKTILIMAGGTGGHVFPALACAQALQQRGYCIHWLGTARGVEAQIIPEAGIRLHTISVNGLRGKGVLKLLMAPWMLACAFLQALVIVIKLRPVLVLGMGGFATGPGALAAKLLRKPLVIHEQNTVAGLTNRLLAPLADRVLEAFNQAFPLTIKTESVGNPIRTEISALVNAQKNEVQTVNRPVRLLVLGGSLGAKVINDLVPQFLADINGQYTVEVWHQTGQRTYKDTLAKYKECSVEAKLEAFIGKMDEAYAWADIVLCRAGALTVSEVATAGIAAIFVPFPYAVDDHQTKNAEYLVQLDGAKLLQQNEFNLVNLKQCLTPLLEQPKIRLKMAQNAHKLASPLATQRVAEVCLEVMNND